MVPLLSVLLLELAQCGLQRSVASIEGGASLPHLVSSGGECGSWAVWRSGAGEDFFVELDHLGMFGDDFGGQKARQCVGWVGYWWGGWH